MGHTIKTGECEGDVWLILCKDFKINQKMLAKNIGQNLD